MGKANILQTTFVCQIAIVVRDAAWSAKRFAELIDVDVPEPIIANADGSDTVRLRGKPTLGRVKLTFFDLENTVLEFIEPTEDPSTWKEFLETHGQGVHHIAFKARNRMHETAQALESFGFPMVQYGDKYAYVDSVDDLGVILELLDID